MGVASDNWFDRVLLQSLTVRVQTLMLIDVQTPFLGIPLVPLNLLLLFWHGVDFKIDCVHGHVHTSLRRER